MSNITPLQPAVLIGIGGFKTAGKDALADAFRTNHGYTVLGMSDALHSCLMVLDPIVGASTYPRALTYRQAFEEFGYVGMKRLPEVRRLQQVFGTEVGRNMISENIWQAMTERQVRSLLDQGIDVVVTGIRFENEFDMIKRLGGHTVWVTRPGVEGSDHPSESGLRTRTFDQIIDNDGTLEDLQGETHALHDHAARYALDGASKRQTEEFFA